MKVWNKINWPILYLLAIIFVAAVPATRANSGAIYAGTNGFGIYKSTDGGASWSAINAGLTNLAVTSIVVDPNNPSTLYAGTRGEIFKSTNGGGNWIPASSGLPDADNLMLSLTIDPSNSEVLYVGVFDNFLRDSIFKTVDGGASWAAVGIIENRSVVVLAVSPADPNVIYAATDLACNPAPCPHGLFKSTDGGAHWITLGLNFAGYPSLVIDPSNPSTLYAVEAGGRGVLKSNDSGENWTAANSGIPQPRRVAINPSNPSTLYALASDGVYKSVDGASSWTKTVSGFLGFILGSQLLAIDPANPSTVFAVFQEGVFKTTNGGGTWFSSSSGLPELGPGSTAVTTLAIEPSSFVSVNIDIKPGDDKNTINMKSNGTVLVAILSSAEFDATTVDPATVTLAEAHVVTQGKADIPITNIQDVNRDGRVDLVLHFKTQDLQLASDVTEAVLLGETFSGEFIRGVDSVRIVPSR